MQALVSYAGGAISFSCVVTQLSATGAKIAVGEQTIIPEHFQIAIPQKGLDCGARLVWRRAGHAGIAFDAAAAGDAGDPTQSLQAKVRWLEAENKALRATVDKLTVRLSKYVDGY